MWIISLAILLIFLWLKDSSDRTDAENRTWILQGKHEMETFIKTGQYFSEDYVNKMHRKWGYEFDPWYPDWVEKGIVTYKPVSLGRFTKLETEKEIEYWTQKMKLPQREFEKWMEKQWEGKLIYCFDKMKILRASECKNRDCFELGKVGYYKVIESEFASEYFLD